MDNPPSRERDSKSLPQPKIEGQASKRRKVVQKHVVRVRIEANVGKQRGDGPPSDSWSWRKYGQKPIKGSPYPRGYYKCSTSKGCSAKKQVERCKTDASVLIITYTSSHNHPGPDLSPTIPTTPPLQTKSTLNDITSGPGLCNGTASLQCSVSQQSETTVKEEPVNDAQDHLHIQLDERGSLACPPMVSFPPTPPPKSSEEAENDFFDELGELPISSSLTSLVRSSCFFDERILLPS